MGFFFGFAALAACGDDTGGTETGGEQNGDGNGGGGGAETPDTNREPVHPCSQGELIAADDLVHHFASDSGNYYWIGSDDIGIAIFALPKAGGDVRTVTSFPGYFSFILDQTTLPVSGDSQFLMSNLVADDLDDYLYFSGDSQIWRVKKDGSEPVQPVSGEGLDELGAASCNFAESILTQDSLYTCRRGNIFRMSRSGDVTATVVYEAPEESAIAGFAISGDRLYTNGAYDSERHLAPLLEVSLATGEAREVGEMLEALVPDSVYLVGEDLVFNSLFIGDAPDLETASEWATRQGTYRINPDEQVPTKISDSNIGLAFEAAGDDSAVYTLIGAAIYRIGIDGTTRALVDCNDAIGTDDEVSFRDLWVDADGVYVRGDGAFYRFDK
jgi:hypothetical protein